MFTYGFDFGVALSTLLICLVNLFYAVSQKSNDKVQNKIYIIIEVILILNAVTGLYNGYARMLIESGKSFHIILGRFWRYMYFISHTALCPMFFYYVAAVSGVSLRISNKKMILQSLFFVVTEILVLINPFTGWVYVLHDDMTFERHWAEYLIYLAALFYFILTFYMLFSSWDVLSSKRKNALFLFFTFVGAGVLVQLLFPNLRVEVICEAIGFTGVLLAVENEDDRMDFGMGFYNRAALNLDVKSCIHNNRNSQLLVLRILNSDVLVKMLGADGTEMFSEVVGKYLTHCTKRYNIYSPKHDTFVIKLPDQTQDEALVLAQEISERFDKTWRYAGRDFAMQLAILVTDVPGRLSSTKELFYLLEAPIPEDIDKRILMDEDLDYIFRMQQVEAAVTRGLNEKSFEVYYQPTFNMDRTLHGAEALLRMHDRKLGNLFPDEFIPVAEKIGMIDEIDDFVLDEVCRFIHSGVPKQYGMDSINVNLSVLQCMRPGFVERVSAIVEKWGVDKHFINFEITESIAATDYRILSLVIARLKLDGFMFSMDDYGTGYSNVSAVLSLNLDVIKIDKSLLWNAEKSELGKIILENTVNMIQRIKKQILVEGVETGNQIRMLSKLNVDYLQGYYFSKPIPKAEFTAFIRRVYEAVNEKNAEHNR